MTFNVLKEFVIEKRIRNFTYQVNIDSDNHSLEKLVNEAPPFVKMSRYSDLVVKISDFNYI